MSDMEEGMSMSWMVRAVSSSDPVLLWRPVRSEASVMTMNMYALVSDAPAPVARV